LEPVEPGLAVSEPLAVTGHISLDCVVTDGNRWENNLGADYRLWIDFEPLDGRMPGSGRGSGELGISSLGTAMASAGIGYGIVSWFENRALDRLKGLTNNLFPLVWVRPGETSVEEVGSRLAGGFVGINPHPAVDEYHADDHDLDRYIEIAAEIGCPVACHSAPGEADPDHIRRLAERFPPGPGILDHTFFGPTEGRRRAAVHVREQSNLYLESSWCEWREVLQLVEETNVERMLF